MGVEGEFSDTRGGWGLAFPHVNIKRKVRLLSFTLKPMVWWVLGLAVFGGTALRTFPCTCFVGLLGLS